MGTFAALSVADSAVRWATRLSVPANDVLVVTAPAVVGFAAFGPDRVDPSVGELYAINLEPSSWGRGAGRQLHDAVMEQLDGTFPRSRLWVLRGNERAMRFYRAAGWQPDGGHKIEGDLEEFSYARSSLNPRWESTNPSRS